MGMVVNPNITSAKSFYLRKLNVVLGFTMFYCVGQKFAKNQYLFMLGQIHDYLPWEVKRALETKDFRYIKMLDFDQLKQSRKLWDDATGKSLS